MTHKYPYRISLWQEYLIFCYKIHSKKQFFKALSLALSHNANNLKFWLLGVYYEFDVQKNPFKARKLFFKALKLNGRNLDFWLEYFSFEIKFLAILAKRAKFLGSAEKNEKTAENAKNAKNAENAENAKNAENAENAKNAENEKTAENAENLKNDDFIGFIEENKEKFDLEGKGWNKEKELEILRTIYETCKEKFDRKAVVLGFLKRIKLEEKAEKNEFFELFAFKSEIMKDSAFFLKESGVFAIEIMRESFLDAEEISALIEEIAGNTKEFMAFLKDFLKKPLEDKGFYDVLTKKIQEKVAEMAYEDSKGFIEIFSLFLKVFGKENLAFLEEIEEFLEISMRKSLEFIGIYVEILVFRGFFTEEKVRVLLKILKKSLDCKENKLQLLKSVVFYVKAGNLREKKLGQEILSAGIENFLLNPSQFSCFLKEFLLYLEEIEEEKEGFFARILVLKRSCPLEIWLEYLRVYREKLSYTEKEAIFRRLNAWFPKNVAVKKAGLALEESEGNYVKAQTIARELAGI